MINFLITLLPFSFFFSDFCSTLADSVKSEPKEEIEFGNTQAQIGYSRNRLFLQTALPYGSHQEIKVSFNRYTFIDVFTLVPTNSLLAQQLKHLAI